MALGDAADQLEGAEGVKAEAFISTKDLGLLAGNGGFNGLEEAFLHTYGAKKEGYFKSIEAAVSGKQAEILGGYECFGFNTFGPFKLIGGIAKGHPDSDEISGAVKFYEQLSK